MDSTHKVSRISCLDKGFVELIDVFPKENPEAAIVAAARISTSMEPQIRTPTEDKNLIRYLYRNKHTSPFEMVKFKFVIKAPIEVARHFMRHRTANVNEFSGRYSEFKDEFYNPLNFENGIRFEDSSNKQGSMISDQKVIPLEVGLKFTIINGYLDSIYKIYNSLIHDDHVAKEVARYCLPVSMYTSFYFSIDLHNLLHLLELRLDEHSQLETRIYAKAMYDLISEYIPTVVNCFETFTLNSIKLSQDEVKAIKDKTLELSRQRENKEFQDKLRLLNLGN